MPMDPSAGERTRLLGVLMCRDSDENLWARSLEGERKLLGRAKRGWQFWRTPKQHYSDQDIIAAFHPTMDLSSLTPQPHRWNPDSSQRDEGRGR